MDGWTMTSRKNPSMLLMMTLSFFSRKIFFLLKKLNPFSMKYKKCHQIWCIIRWHFFSHHHSFIHSFNLNELTTTLEMTMIENSNSKNKKKVKTRLKLSTISIYNNVHCHWKSIIVSGSVLFFIVSNEHQAKFGRQNEWRLCYSHTEKKLFNQLIQINHWIMSIQNKQIMTMTMANF